MTMYAGAERKERHYWTILLILLLLGGILCLGGMLFFQGIPSAQGSKFVPVHLHSVLEANYNVDPNPPRLPGVRLDLIWAAISDHERDVTDLKARQAALLTSLQTPVPFVTSQVCQGSHTIYTDQDTWLDSARPTATYGHETILEIGRDGDHLRRILLYFSLSDKIPQDTFIYSARLEMNVVGGASLDPPPFQFYNLMEPFKESTTSWANQPETYISYYPPPFVVPDIHAWDVTDIVQAWLLGRYPNNGLVLEPQSSSDFTLFYYSQEADQQTKREFTPVRRVGPRLIIECEAPPLPTAIAAAPPTIIPNLTNTPPLEPTSIPMPQVTNTPPPPTAPLTPPPPSPTSLPATSTAPPSTPTSPPSTPTTPPSTPTSLPASPTNPTPTPTGDSPDDDDDGPPEPAPPPPPPPSANLAIGKTASPNPVTVGNNLTYNLNITNNGPSNATGVTVIDTLPANVTLVSATPSQGTCSGTNIITCNLGSIANGSNATITIVVTVDPLATSPLTNSATASANETDPDPGNNTATAAVNVTPSVIITINDVSITEGNAGSTSAVFTVTLSMASVQTITVDYATADGTATAPADYTATGNTLSFSPGVTQQTLSVQVIGDTAVEGNHSFFVNLSNPSNATIADNQGVGTIIDDDSVSITINDVSITEGNAGSTSAVFTVTLSMASAQTITVDYATADGSATDPADYTAASNTLSFSPGVTQQTLSVQVIGDTAFEGDHSFFVNLSNPSNATIADNQGVGTIIDDDSGTTLCSSPTVTLTATGDTWIMESNPSLNNGADSNLHVKPDSSVGFRTLIQFDLSSIPPTTTISCAAILLFEKDADATQTIYLHQVNASWLEAQATWNNRTAANPWASAGGDYTSSPAASFTPDVTDLQQVDITALTQFWVDNPGSNFGVLLRSTTSGGNTDIQFGSREGSDPIPRLIVEY